MSFNVFQRGWLKSALAAMLFFVFCLTEAFALAQVKPGQTNRSSDRDANSKSNRKIAQIPFEFFNNLIFLQVSINGSQRFSLLLDSGVTNTIIDRLIADQLKLDSFAAGSSTGIGEKTETVQVFKNVKMEVAGISHAPPVLIAAPGFAAPSSAAIGRQMSGALGTDFIKRFVIEVDYENHLLNLYEPGAYKYSGKGQVLPVELINDAPYIVASIATAAPSSAIQGLFEVDSGFTGSVTFNTPFSAAKNLLAQTPRKIASSSVGLGGETKEFTGRLSFLQLGDIRLREPIAGFPQVKSGALASNDRAGLIGDEVLSRFKVIFDYSRNRIILEPTLRLNEPFESDMSGIGFRYEGANFKTFRVNSVQENSAASEAGLQKGDVVNMINDQNAEALTADDLRRMFKQKGKTYCLRFLRNGEQKTVTLTTRRLL